MTVIYLLRDPRDLAVRYVGKTCQPLKTRLGAHIQRSASKKTHRDCWISGLASRGLRPTIEVVEAVEGDWQARERHWIAHYRALDYRLTNSTIGGEGIDPQAAALSWTPARRAAQAARTAAMNHAKSGERWTEERKHQQSCAQLRRYQRAGEREASRTRAAVIVSAPGYREKQSTAQAAAWTEERRAAQAEVARRVNQRRWGPA